MSLETINCKGKKLILAAAETKPGHWLCLFRLQSRRRCPALPLCRWRLCGARGKGDGCWFFGTSVFILPGQRRKWSEHQYVNSYAEARPGPWLRGGATHACPSRAISWLCHAASPGSHGMVGMELHHKESSLVVESQGVQGTDLSSQCAYLLRLGWDIQVLDVSLTI